MESGNDDQHRHLQITTDDERFEVGEVLALLKTTFWGNTITAETLSRAIQHSVCFGCFEESVLIGFGRVITDLATFAYWTDVVVAPGQRGRGIGTLLCRSMMDHPKLQHLRRISLLTRDAANMYSRLGFTTDLGDLTYMELRAPGEPTT